MDRNEAMTALDGILAQYRTRSYAELVSLVSRPIASSVTGPSGAVYQIEVQVFWDGPANGDLRVMGSVDDGGWRAFLPLSADFVVTPAGGFVGE